MDKYLGEDDLIFNTASRIPVCLCIDTSSSMNKVISGEMIFTGETEFSDGRTWNIVELGEDGKTLLSNMNEGIKKFYDAVRRDEQARMSCELAVVTFSDEAECIEDFKGIESSETVEINNTGNNTAICKGINLALDLLENRKNQYKENGVDYYQPWLVIFTDGESTEDEADIQKVQERIKQLEDAGKLTVFTFALDDEANIEALSRFSKRKPISIKKGKIEEFFEWLGKSVSIVSQSQVGEKIKLDISDMGDWAEI